MKNKKTNKKDLKDLFAFGGVAMNVATPSEELAKAQRVSQQAHFGAMSDPTVAGLRGVGNMMISTGMSMASKGMSQNGDMSGIGGFLQDNMGTINSLVGAGQSASYYHAAGGVVNNKNINAEGGEVIETPGGQPQELQGPSHSQGGINMQVPSGTEIYSDRLLGADGKTMAERKKIREKQISKIEKLLQKNPNDSALKKTLEKTKQNNDFLDKQDLSQMQFVKDLVDHTNKFAFGGIADEDEEEYKMGGTVKKFLTGGTNNPNDPIYSPEYFGMSKDSSQLPDGAGQRTYNQFLENIGYKGKLPKGYYGGLSKQDIKELQTLVGVEADGIWGDKTFTAVEKGYDDYSYDPTNSRDKAYATTTGIPYIVYKESFDQIKQNITKDLNTTNSNPTSKFLDSGKDGIPKYIDSSTGTGPEVYAPASTDPEGKYGNATSAKTKDAKNFSLDNYLGGTTLGDMIGMGANLFGANAQMKNTLANRNATPLEQNAFKNFGDQALKKIQSQYGLLDDVRDNQLQDAERNRQGTIARNNNSARGINTQRALNLATDSSMNELKANIYNQYASNAMGVTKEEAAQMDRNDQMRMVGEEKRAERELQNTDNFFSDMAKNISDKYRSIGETGKALNQTKQRETTNEILKDMNPNYEYDPYTGKLITKKTETLETEKAKDADIRRQGAVKSTSLENVYTKDDKLNPNKITQVKGNKHLSTKNYTSTDNANLQSVMKKLNIDTLDFDNQDSIRTLQKALRMKSSDIAAGKFGQKTLLAIKKYLENNK